MMSVVSPDGTSIAYTRSGSGPPLVLVHGTSADHSRWSEVHPFFDSKYTVYSIDRRGRGGSSDTQPYALEREFEDITAVVNSIGEPVYLLGHSFGALVCLEASLRTTHIAKLVLYEPYLPLAADTRLRDIAVRIAEMVATGDREQAVLTLFSQIAELPQHEVDLLRSQPTWSARIAAAHTISRETVAEVEYSFFPERFTNVQLPVLLLLGGESPASLRESTLAIHRALTNNTLRLMPGQRHIAMSTAPELFASMVIDFISDPA